MDPQPKFFTHARVAVAWDRLTQLREERHFTKRWVNRSGEQLGSAHLTTEYLSSVPVAKLVSEVH